MRENRLSFWLSASAVCPKNLCGVLASVAEKSKYVVSGKEFVATDSSRSIASSIDSLNSPRQRDRLPDFSQGTETFFLSEGFEKSAVSGNMAVDTDSSVSSSFLLGSGYKPDLYALSSDAPSPVGAPEGL
jgi:hypothetical protein